MRARRILIADYCQDTLDAIQQALRAHGRECWAWMLPTGSASFCKYAHLSQPDVIVWDVPLPYEHYWQEFLRMLGTNNMGRWPYVLTSTAMLKIDDHGFLLKPFPIEELINALEKAVTRDR